jgi:AcrR family transcriptional regulator
MRADARANRQRILTSAAELFAAQGLAVSLDEIARHADLGPGTLHRHFPTKDGLIAAVALERLEELVAAAQHRAGGEDPVAALRDQLSEMVVAGDGNAPLKQALAGTPDDVAWSQTDVSRRLRDALGVLLASAQQAGGARSDLDAADLMSLLAGCYSAVQRAGVPAGSKVGLRLTSVLLAGLGLLE